ncbi:glutathione S-transferase N-terminal domain-containing protein [Chitiniphilus purpureus]|uniref:Glutathione S-transferase N-terminal domain-containing protein n=1 Tax=Chitiniphilus purpureus TaxID=2981137 RepID=A0ABY6DQN7_9NEIS|nr:glutathione S-transferase N-terminal domain-containing protein [Chitiniphilus sp. CD1]UXY15791.1 glutathione S-transferase N-terminal domain-containing protein [Chitiniphilus sp. CD1]
MITLYELPWSHYCEKVRLALAWQGVRWRSVSCNAFSKAEIHAVADGVPVPRHAFPAIRDEATGALVFESTPILDYLEARFPDAPRLFPGDAANRAAIRARLIEFDTLLGIAARRVAYTQVILECPALLPQLFLGRVAGGVFTRPGLRWLAGHSLGLLLTKRFAFHRSEAMGLYEALEHYLLALADALHTREFVVGEAFSAADLALAAQLRPLLIVPCFAEHPGLQPLFARQRRVFEQLGASAQFPYQTAVDAARRRRAPVRRRLRVIDGALPMALSPGQMLAGNDQCPVWTWSMLLYPWHYCVGLRRNKARRTQACAVYR